MNGVNDQPLFQFIWRGVAHKHKGKEWKRRRKEAKIRDSVGSKEISTHRPKKETSEHDFPINIINNIVLFWLRDYWSLFSICCSRIVARIQSLSLSLAFRIRRMQTNCYEFLCGRRHVPTTYRLFSTTIHNPHVFNAMHFRNWFDASVFYAIISVVTAHAYDFPHNVNNNVWGSNRSHCVCVSISPTHKPNP